MSLPIVFRRVARAEFDDAADWYEQRRAGLGAAFVAAVQDVLDQIADQPQSHAVVLGDVREAMVSGFPYCVYYREEPGQVLVLAVFHTARDPSIWQGRI
ncbi:MAG TPA: type II toxin-antitoxin system RelE/ParE family toxin [Gemmataceae bacterium]|jgi:toxin ParE1/3/4|nr:type II toxin-antitoxin system RelE/ParE family toxin [Gemmataceae bacterium]